MHTLMTKPEKILIVLMTAMLAGLIGCEKQASQDTYTEIVVDSPLEKQMPVNDPHAGLRNMPGMTDPHAGLDMNDPHAGLQMPGMPGMDPHAGLGMMPGMEGMADSDGSTDLTWTTPQGWAEQKGNGMRLATFTSTDPAHPIECTIIRLGPEAGEVKPNVLRWMGQINFSVPDEELNAFLGRQEKIVTADQQNGVVIDMTQLQGENNPAAPSMIAVMLLSDEATIFVKMTGQKQDVLNHKERLLQLCRSIKSVE